jgi:hypothetical protein
MHYAIAIGIFIAIYILGFVLPLVFGGTGSVIRLAIFSVPVLLAGPRVAQRFTDGSPLLTEEFRREGGLMYGVGTVLIWLGHLLFFGSIGAAVYFSAQDAQGLPVGLVTGYAMYPYLVGTVLVELAFRQWSKGKIVPRWKSQRNSIYITVALVVGAQLFFNLSSDRPVDLLSYSEREALAWGNGYSREVKRKAEEFYKAENRLPCVDDNFIDVTSLLGGSKADRSKALSIDILDCGRFVATIHRPIDGIVDGQLLFVASPGDADAGTPLDWQCFSPQFERIERHTNGRCTYDSSLANITPMPVAARPTVAAAEQPLGVVADRGPSIQDFLDRLAEPTLWEDCGEEVSSYRLLKFDAHQYVASVRVSRESRFGTYRTATSSSPGKFKSLEDGFVDEKTWELIESQFDAAGFWSLRSEPGASRSEGNRIYVEACRDGKYRAVEREAHDSALAPIVRTITTFGQLEWLEGG